MSKNSNFKTIDNIVVQKVPSREKSLLELRDVGNTLDVTIENLPSIIEGDAKLQNLFDSRLLYKVVYSGENLVFLQGLGHNGDDYRIADSIIRASLVPDGVGADGAVVVHDGININFKEENSDNLYYRFKFSIPDVNSDVLDVTNMEFRLGIKASDFREKYLKDFLAHAFVMGDYILNSSVNEKGLLMLNERDVDELPDKYRFGLSGSTLCEILTESDDFAFKLELSEGFYIENFLSIVGSLKGYVEDLGIPYSVKYELDEKDQRMLNLKLRERSFQKRNIGMMQESLQDIGMLKVLTYALYGDEYKFVLGEMKECGSCGKWYADGIIDFLNSDVKDYNGRDILNISELHFIVEHPENYLNLGNNFRKAYKLVKDAKDFKPLFFSSPDLIPDLIEFDELLTVRSEWDFKYYNSLGSMPDAEDDIIEEKRELYNNKVLEKAEVLRENYGELIGKTITRENEPPWDKEAVALDLYQKLAPYIVKSLAEK